MQNRPLRIFLLRQKIQLPLKGAPEQNFWRKIYIVILNVAASYGIMRGVTMAKNDRFEKVYTQGAFGTMEIWVDKETGVNYLYHQSGYSGGMTPLLDRDGKPVVSPIVNRYEK